MRQLPFQRHGRFFRGNLHTHTTRSDGEMTPEEVVSAYRSHGYDFVAITDHLMERFGFSITDTSSLRSAEFTTLIGAELHAPALANGEIWHIVAVGIPTDFAPPSPEESGPSLAARAAEAGAFVGLAHPAWYGLSLDDIRSVEAAHAIEVYNETCVMLNDRGDSWHALDMLLAEGRRLTAFGADDAHFRQERPDTYGASVWVRAERLDPEEILAALKAGHYYTSQGPLIHDISVSDDEIAVSCSPASSVFVAGVAARAKSAHGRGITKSRFPRELFDGSYCRVTIVDHSGRRAWSNPIWLD